MNNQHITILFIVGVIASLLIARTITTSDDRPIIGIIQTASHPALDAAHDGFVQAVAAHAGNRFRIVTQNAQGDISQAKTIATRFAHDKKTALLFCIATPALQAALSTQNGIPLVFTAVTEPKLVGVSSATGPLGGHCDKVDPADQVKTCLQLAPHAKRIALIHNTSEVNAVHMTELLTRELEKQGRSPVLFGVTSEADIPLTAPLACKKGNAIICPIDNTIALTIDVLAHHALMTKTPLIVGDNMLIRDGVLASCGVDYHELGVKSGEMAAQHLLTGTPLNIVATGSSERVIHQSTATALGLNSGAVS